MREPRNLLTGGSSNFHKMKMSSILGSAPACGHSPSWDGLTRWVACLCYVVFFFADSDRDSCWADP